MEITVAAKEYADWFIGNEYKRQQGINPERLAALPQSAKDEFEAGWHATSLELATAIRDKSELFIKKASQGMLHPSNGASRRLFTAITGIVLPSTVGGTDKALQEYAGVEIGAYRAAKQAERDAKESAEKAKEDAKYRERIDKVIGLVRGGEMVEAEQLIDLVRHLGIDVHPRTIGAIRTHVVTIGPEGARVYKRKTKAPQSMYSVYKQCQDLIHEVRPVKDAGYEAFCQEECEL